MSLSELQGLEQLVSSSSPTDAMADPFASGSKASQQLPLDAPFAPSGTSPLAAFPAAMDAQPDWFEMEGLQNPPSSSALDAIFSANSPGVSHAQVALSCYGSAASAVPFSSAGANCAPLGSVHHSTTMTKRAWSHGQRAAYTMQPPALQEYASWHNSSRFNNDNGHREHSGQLGGQSGSVPVVPSNVGMNHSSPYSKTCTASTNSNTRQTPNHHDGGKLFFKMPAPLDLRSSPSPSASFNGGAGTPGSMSALSSLRSNSEHTLDVPLYSASPAATTQRSAASSISSNGFAEVPLFQRQLSSPVPSLSPPAAPFLIGGMPVSASQPVSTSAGVSASSSSTNSSSGGGAMFAGRLSSSSPINILNSASSPSQAGTPAARGVLASSSSPSATSATAKDGSSKTPGGATATAANTTVVLGSTPLQPGVQRSFTNDSAITFSDNTDNVISPTFNATLESLTADVAPVSASPAYSSCSDTTLSVTSMAPAPALSFALPSPTLKTPPAGLVASSAGPTQHWRGGVPQTSTAMALSSVFSSLSAAQNLGQPGSAKAQLDPSRIAAMAAAAAAMATASSSATSTSTSTSTPTTASRLASLPNYPVPATEAPTLVTPGAASASKSLELPVLTTTEPLADVQPMSLNDSTEMPLLSQLEDGSPSFPLLDLSWVTKDLGGGDAGAVSGASDANAAMPPITPMMQQMMAGGYLEETNDQFDFDVEPDMAPRQKKERRRRKRKRLTETRKRELRNEHLKELNLRNVQLRVLTDHMRVTLDDAMGTLLEVFKVRGGFSPSAAVSQVGVRA